MSRLLTFCLSLVVLIPCSCGNSSHLARAEGLPEAHDTVSFQILGLLLGRDLIIRDTIDLDNKRCNLPEDVCLLFKGGVIRNGTLVGNRTSIKSSRACFEFVRILGTWNVPIIKSSLFCDLSYDNALKDVLALSDSAVMNEIIIEKGEYSVTAKKNGDICIPVYSNAELILNGTIILTPNDYTNYYIIQATGHNITIQGKGTVIGDKHAHTGNKGEWGMGINLANAHHTVIKGLTIKDCWGDCIYVGSESSDVKIENCVLDHGRRQGISITSADSVLIRNCTITNVEGTNPEYAIDVEPNKGEVVDNIAINHVAVKNCKGGILVYGNAPNAYVGKVSIKNCNITRPQKIPISIIKCSSAIVEKCTVKGYLCQKESIKYTEVGSMSLKKNTLE